MRTTIWLWLSMVVLGVAATVAAQDSPRFDVVSIKPNRSGDPLIRLDTEPGGRFITVNAPLRSLLRLAYGIEDFEIVGAPDWARSEGFDIIAVGRQELPLLEGPGRGSAPLRTLLQALLRDRFSLTAHVEAREAAGLALVAQQPNRPGPRLTQSQIDCAALIARARSDAGAATCGFRMSPGSIVLEGVPMTTLASGLGGLLGRRVVDRTALTGNFDLQLHWDPPMPSPDGGLTPTPAVSLFTALGDQAGLRLIETQVQGTVLVVDAVSRPTPN
ncbi:MAG TPA: TIGR03435 family protein [Vicinamibacterales bacterium]|nr:TIGR03435 family protein [Vicinamibacterales bacterium]